MFFVHYARTRAYILPFTLYMVKIGILLHFFENFWNYFFAPLLYISQFFLNIFHFSQNLFVNVL